MRKLGLVAVIGSMLFLGACEDTEGSISWGGGYIGTSDNTDDFQGYIGGMFDIEVNGKTYSDSEDFYTAEMNALPEKLAAAGYSGQNFSFLAELGFDDLWRNTTVNIASMGDQGFQGKTLVKSEDGSFVVSLPKGAFGSYQIKSVKRLNLLLDDGTQFCYNFKGVTQNFDFNPESDPVIITKFESTLTKYKCPTADSQAISIQVGKDLTVTKEYPEPEIEEETSDEDLTPEVEESSEIDMYQPNFGYGYGQ